MVFLKNRLLKWYYSHNLIRFIYVMLDFLHVFAIVVIVGLLSRFVYLDRLYQKANPNYPSLLITIGIGFTFFGVALGLMDFNTEDPTESLSTLVNGIKTAFWGSFAGVAASIVIKSHALICLKENSADLEGDKQIQQFYREHQMVAQQSHFLEKIYKDNQNNHQNLVKTLENFGVNLEKNNKTNMQEMLQSINSSLSGIEQIQRSTQGYIAGEIAELRNEFVSFAQKQSEQTTEIFIKALEEAIQRFNENLTDSLGENFKQLNQSVHRLVDWQDQYASQVEQQTAHYEVMLSQIEQVKNDFSMVLHNVDGFKHVIQQLDQAIQSIDHTNHEFNGRIERFYGGLDAKLIEVDQTRQLFVDSFNKTEQQMEKINQLTETVFGEIHEYLESSHTRALQIQTQSAQQSEQMQKQMKQSFEQTQQQLSDGLTTIENQLQQTLNQSLITLAQQLGSLSTKFAQDYEPITENLKNIIDSIDQGVKS